MSTKSIIPLDGTKDERIRVVFCDDTMEDLKYPFTPDDKRFVREVNKYKSHSKKTKYEDAVTEWNERQTKVEKTCKKCGNWKLLCEYDFNCSGNCHFNKEGFRHQRPECKECMKKERRTTDAAKAKSKKEGLPVSAPEGTKCELCGTIHNIIYDHDHEAERFRGWICDPCNRGLGQCRDDVEGVLSRLEYVLTKRILLKPEEKTRYKELFNERLIKIL